MTEISAPVSTKNVKEVIGSLTNKRLELKLPAVVAATTVRFDRFPNAVENCCPSYRCTSSYSFGLDRRIFDENNRRTIWHGNSSENAFFVYHLIGLSFDDSNNYFVNRRIFSTIVQFVVRDGMCVCGTAVMDVCGTAVADATLCWFIVSMTLSPNSAN